ncbi:EutP/PduV family microcompartment system protein [[Clostridium] colinum]|uniref:EutP/PduV family microcompartment system protein n=1 Tax=[Clostridium] colinum TaxID=36835 RepID=UPI0020258AFA|nr:EutP/PduV family microcompartment system protein [[Clostridium] colinum]
MKKVIFIGKTGAGKTTLCQKLDELDIKYKKTQSVETYENSIDTPGEYLENRRFYSALSVTSAEADIIAIIYDPTVCENFIAPNFASMFAKETIGIITKINLATNEQIEKAEIILKNALVNKIFKIDTIYDIGISELRDYLES